MVYLSAWKFWGQSAKYDLNWYQSVLEVTLLELPE